MNARHPVHWLDACSGVDGGAGRDRPDRLAAPWRRPHDPRDGGAVAAIGGLVFDGSLRTQLRQLRTSLTKEG